MSLKVRYFAAARERAGCSEEPLPLPEPPTVDALVQALAVKHPLLAALLPHLRVAVNQEFRTGTHVLVDADEVALIPPVAGGAGLFHVVDRPLSLDEVVAAVSGPRHGGVVTFTGCVRDETRGRKVVRLEYEAYGEMAVKQLQAIGDDVQKRFGARLAISHRVGTLKPSELAVVIAAAAAHRDEAFLACRHAIEALKRDVPIWKREVYEDGEVWVGLGP